MENRKTAIVMVKRDVEGETLGKPKMHLRLYDKVDDAHRDFQIMFKQVMKDASTLFSATIDTMDGHAVVLDGKIETLMFIAPVESAYDGVSVANWEWK